MVKATFAAGCFWQVEETFRCVKGVTKTTVGYTGGHTKDPTYEDVCYTETGHAESLQVEFDPKVVSYSDLLKLFWESHDPTQHNRQGPDIGSQYRSAVFYHSAEQKKIAEKSKEAYQKKLKKPIMTEIVKAEKFYVAEDYHQQYLAKRGQSTCRI